MPEAKFTPGPWYPGHHTDDSHPCNCTAVLAEGYFGAVCHVNHSVTRAIEEGDNPPPDEARANARLIAAAPDLLEALKLARDYMNLSLGSTYEGENPFPIIDAALAKAQPPHGGRG